MPCHLQNGIKIKVESQTLVLRGDTEESAGCVLRGCLVMHQRERTRLKSLNLSLIGLLKVYWSKNIHVNRWSSHSLSVSNASESGTHHQRHHKATISILDHEWTFLDPCRKSYTVEAGTYVYPFEYAFPGHLPETIHYGAGGSVHYKLKAVAERPTLLHSNWSDQLDLVVMRHLTETLCNFPVAISNTWAEQLSYKLTIPKKTYRRGENVTITCLIEPYTSGDLSVRNVTCILKEYFTFIANDGAFRTESRAIRIIRDNNFPSSGRRWQKAETLTIPRSVQTVHCDVESRIISIGHKLQLAISLINADKRISELRDYLPVAIVQGKNYGAFTETDSVLPGYEDARQAPPYFPASAIHFDASVHIESSWLQSNNWRDVPINATNHPGLDRSPSYHTVEEVSASRFSRRMSSS